MRRHRPLLCLAALSGLTACPAQYELGEPVPQYIPPPEPQPGPLVYPEELAALMLVNASTQPQLFRVRALRSEVQINCAAMAADPGRRLVPELFGPARAWWLEPGRATNALSNGLQAGCNAALIDGPALEPRVLFFDTDTLPAQYLSTEGPAVAPDRALAVSGSPEAMHWAEHPALFRPLTPQEDGPACGTPALGTGVDWSTPPTGVVGLQGWTVGADGCYALDLEVGEAAERWFVCAPGVTLPFAVNDVLRVAPAFWGANGVAVDGLVIEGPQSRLTLTRGADLPVAHSFETLAGCDGHIDTCGAFVQAGRVVVGETPVEVGEAWPLNDLATLHLYRAELSASTRAGCSTLTQPGLPTFEAALVEYFAAEEPAAEEPATEEPAAEDPPAEEPTGEDPPAEEPTPEDPPAEEPPAEEPAPDAPPASGSSMP